MKRNSFFCVFIDEIPVTVFEQEQKLKPQNLQIKKEFQINHNYKYLVPKAISNLISQLRK